MVDNSALQLDRTRIEAPFNAFVQEEHAEMGQVVGPQSQLATLVGTDTFWVQVNLPIEKLAQIYVPGVNGSEGSTARVWQRVGDKRLEREGRVIRLQGSLDPVGRLARLLIEIDDPLRLQEPDDEGGDPTRLPLLLGAFVHVEIEGRAMEEVVDLPRVALRESDTVYLLTDDNTLEIRPVEVVWGRDESVLVRGLGTGDRVITSNLPAPVEGMPLRLPGMEGEEGTGSGVAPDLRAEPDTGGEVEETSAPSGPDHESPAGPGGAMPAPPSVEGEPEAPVATASE
jgi:multidrug efflux pump subunit AcrA (membrane-fusion protein)